MGRVSTASKKSIQLDFYYNKTRLRPVVKLPPTARNLKYCERLVASIEIEIEKGIFDCAKHFPDYAPCKRFSKQPGENVLIKNALVAWLNHNKEYWKSSTYNGYKKIVDGRLIPAFGELNLTELTRKHVRDWLADQSISHSTAGNIVSCLRTCLDECVEDELIEANPLANWKIKRKRRGIKKEDDIDPFSFKEIQALLNTAGHQVKNLIQFWFFSGLRGSELIALDWANIDFVNGRASITGALTQAADDIEETKTTTGDRIIELSAPAVEALKAQKELTFLKGIEVFSNPFTGERFAGDQALRKRVWVPLLKKAGVRYRPPKQCRHTYASMTLQAGEDVRYIAAQLGHTDWGFTARTYARFIPDNAPERGKKFEQAWSESK